MVCLSDMPKIKLSTYNKIINYFNKNKKFLVFHAIKIEMEIQYAFQSALSLKSKISKVIKEQKKSF